MGLQCDAQNENCDAGTHDCAHSKLSYLPQACSHKQVLQVQVIQIKDSHLQKSRSRREPIFILKALEVTFTPSCAIRKQHFLLDDTTILKGQFNQ